MTKLKISKSGTIVGFVLLICLGCKNYKKIGKFHNQELSSPYDSTINIQFIYYFHILDSLAGSGFLDTTLSAVNAISFMEKQTGIAGEGEGTFFGTFDFTKKDLRRWHKWYEKHKENVRNK